jgi:hypothetical protein
MRPQGLLNVSGISFDFIHTDYALPIYKTYPLLQIFFMFTRIVMTAETG